MISKVLFFSAILFLAYSAFSQQTPKTPRHMQQEAQIRAPDSTAQEETHSEHQKQPFWQIIKNWIEENPALSSVIATILAAFIGVWAQFRGRRKIRDDGTEKLPERKARKKYFEYIEREHGKIRLYGFFSRANIDMRLVDVFVSLRLVETFSGREKARRDDTHEGETEVRKPADVLQRAESQKRILLILGDPGTGKTTLLKHYAICAKDSKLWKDIGLSLQRIPLFIPLRNINPELGFVEALSEWAKQNNLNYLHQTRLQKWLESPGCLVLLDGLDEISDLDRRRKACRWIDKAVTAFDQSIFVVTSRYTGYLERKGILLQKPLLRADVQPLNRDQQETYLLQWFRAAEKDEYGDSKIDKKTQAIIENKAKNQTKQILQVLDKKENKSLRDLATIPVMLQIMAIIQRERGSLKGKRAALYLDSMRYLLEHRDNAKGLEPLLDADQAIQVLRPLAYYMHVKAQKDELPRSEVVKILQNALQQVKPALSAGALLENIRDRAGVLVGSGADHFMFQHKSFREFLTALEIANRGEAQLLVDHFGEKDWWDEVLLFSAGISSPNIFNAFLRLFFRSEKNAGATPALLLQMMEEAASVAQEPFRAILTDKRLAWQKHYNALRCLRLRLPAEWAVNLAREATHHKQEEVRELAVAVLREAEAREREKEKAPQKLEVAIKEDNRFFNPFELNAEYILIPGGVYRFSVTKKTEKVPDMYFAKYPVTNKLYRRFVAYLAGDREMEELLELLPLEQFHRYVASVAGREELKGLDGYLNGGPEAWPGQLRSRYDDDRRFNQDDQPVVAVSWYAARLYCIWLSLLEWRAAGCGEPEWKVLLNEMYRLPYEREWEWAASGGKRKYPWGDAPEPNENLANFDEHVGKTTPVGSYPEGATPEGLMDMAGNVWEWQEDWYDKDKDSCALRGGSWNFSAEDLRCVARSNDLPVVRWYSFGFRVVRAQL